MRIFDQRFFVFLLFSVVFYSKTTAQMSGSFSVGSGGDYATISEAIADINSLGLSGDVTLRISSGTYDEEVDLSNLNNGVYTLALEGEDLENTIISPTYVDVTTFTGIYIEDTDNITIRNLTIEMPVESGGTQIGIYSQDASNLSLEGNMISSKTGIAIVGGTNIGVSSNIVVAKGVALGIENINTVDVINNTLHSELTGFRNNKAGGFDIFTEAVLVFDRVVSNVNVINNIFSGVVSEYADGNAAISFGIDGSLVTTSSTSNLTSNYNLFDADLSMAVVGSEGISSLDNEALVGDFSLDDWDAMGYDLHSISFSPDFIENTNFRARNEDFRFGDYLPEFATDIDGETRIEGSVDIGADQYCISIENTEEVTECHSYEFAGLTLTESGEYLGRFVAMNGCDSLVTLNLTILGPSMGSDDVTAVGSYDWNGTIYSESGSYEQTLTDQLGCDSIATLNLTIEPYLLEGSFIIGSSDEADFKNFTQAIADLQYATLAGDIEYTVEVGTYNDTLKLSNINTGEYSLVFSGDDKATTILHPLDSIDESKSGILIVGTNNVTIQNLTLEMDDISGVSVSSSDTKGISIVDADNITLDNLELKNGSETSDFSSSRFFIISGLSVKNVNEVIVTNSTFGGARSHITLSDHNNVIIEENLFQSPRLGILGTETGRNLSIAHNDFIGPFGFAMELSEVEDLSIRSNDFDGVDNEESWGAIALSENTSTLIQDNFIENVDEGIAFDKDSAVIVEQNRVMLSSSFALEADRTDDLTIANNFFGDVIVLERQSNLDFIHNTVVASSSHESDEVVFFEVYHEANEELTVRFSNNIIVGGDLVADRLIAIVEVNRNEDYSLNLTLDHNLYYLDDESGSKPLVTYEVDVDEENEEETPYTTLTAWKDALLFDQNSQSFAPVFIDTDDFHISSEVDYRFGTFLSDHTLDIDGHLRVESVGVDVGADQNCNPCTIIWDGEWSNEGGPTGSDHAILVESYMTAEDGAFECNNLSVKSEVLLQIAVGTYVDILGDVVCSGQISVLSGGTYLTYNGHTHTGNNVRVQRNTRYSDGKYSFVGTPVQQDASITGADLGNYVYHYDETQAYGTNDGLTRWIDASSQELIPGRGYTQALQQEITFTGIPNDGTITYTGTYTEDTDDANEGWNLVSNPYPAAIHVSSFLTTNTNIEGAVYIWDDNGSETSRGSNADYIVANGTVATNTTPSGSQTRYNQHLGSAQGFFVKLKDNTSTNITFTEIMRVGGSNGDANFFRQSTPSYVRINLTNQAGLFKQAVVGWLDNISDTQLDRSFDAKVFNAAASNALYTLKANEALAIQGVKEREEIPLGLHISETGHYTLNLELDNYGGQDLYLLDKETGEEIDVFANSYSFYAESGQSKDRFVLVKKPLEVLSIELIIKDWQVYTSGKSLYLKKLTEKHETGTFTLYTLTGKEVQTFTTHQSISIDLSNLPKGIYLISNGDETSKVLLED